MEEHGGGGWEERIGRPVGRGGGYLKSNLTTVYIVPKIKLMKQLTIVKKFYRGVGDGV